ncbi:hypothetical protein N7475_007761 [Penicillium sp. IBT 31633x]|nr:hypothetical protein N7475_007761 [Penicillium sp. IBT 31633x]
MDVPNLYTKPTRTYRSDKGFNWRAGVALIFAIDPKMPGLIDTNNAAIEIDDVKYIFAVADILGILVAGGVHISLSYLFRDEASVIEYYISAE